MRKTPKYRKQDNSGLFEFTVVLLVIIPYLIFKGIVSLVRGITDGNA